MSHLLDDIERQARQLSEAERARLAETLLESLQAPSPADIAQRWDDEIARRVAAFERAQGQLWPAEQVFEQARQLGR